MRRPIKRLQLLFVGGTQSGKASGFHHCWPDLIDHHNPMLGTCYLAIYVKCNLPGRMWSIRAVFAPLVDFKYPYDAIYDIKKIPARYGQGL